MRRLAVVLALLVPVYALAQSTITVVSDEAVAGVTVTKTGVDSYTISLSGTAASILHASSHASAGTDPVTLSQSQITGLSTTLSGLVPYTGATGDVNLGSYGFAFDDGGADLLSIYDDIIEMQNTTTGTVTRIYSDYLTSPRLYSTIATGTAPFSVVSTTLNTNLNADMVDGYSIPVPSTSGNVLTSNETGWISAARTCEISATVDGIQTVRTGALRWYPPASCTLVSCTAFVGTAPTGAALTVDVNKNGTSVLASALSIAAGGYSSIVTTPTTTAMTASDYLTVDVDSIGSTEPGRDLTVRIVYTIP